MTAVGGFPRATGADHIGEVAARLQIEIGINIECGELPFEGR